MSQDYRPEEHLIAALVGRQHVRKYQTSPTFKSQVDILAAMLPAWIDGIAASAAHIDDSMELAKQAILAGPVFLNFPELEGLVR